MSIKFKIFIPIASLIMAMVVFQTFYFPSLQTERATYALNVKATTISKLVARQIAPMIDLRLIMADIEGLEKEVKSVFRSAEEDRDLIYVALYDEAGQLFKTDAGVPIPISVNVTDMMAPMWVQVGTTTELNVVEIEGQLQVFTPVKIEDDIKGWVVAAFSRSSIEAERAHGQRLSLVVGLFTLLIGLSVSMGIGILYSKRMGIVAAVVERFAQGDLSQKTLEESSKDELGQLIRSINRMLNSQRELVSSLQQTSQQINTTASDILTNSRQQEQGAIHQSQAVEKTRQTMTDLQQSSQHIADTSHGVLENAELTLQNNRQIGRSIGELSGHSRRIGEILELIKDIANKSDLLALNAALEGTKAGEAGRGFSLVAQQMQRLAENVMQSAVDIKELTADIRDATGASVLASEEALRLAAETTNSARRISELAKQQQNGTEHVKLSMDGIVTIAEEVASGNRLIVEVTRNLVNHSAQLEAMIQRFKLHAPENHNTSKTLL